MTKTVLAIDDSLTIRELINFVLTNAGFNVCLAEDGVEGLEQLAKHNPDIIVTDVNMPRLDGLSFIERARTLAEHRATPILVLTTETGQHLKDRARKAGATGRIVKPFAPPQLLEAIRRVAA
jgi:two-component system, chemotaxis family, chemotaxis protein CheY